VSLRVALLSDRFPPEPGGLAVASERIARGLAAAGDEVEVIAVAANAAPGTVTVEEDAALTLVRVGGHRREDDTGAALFDLIAQRHARRPYDLIHGFYLVRSGFVAAYAGGYLGVPSVVSARGNDLDRALFDPARAATILRALDLASAVTAVSSDLARKAAALAPQASVSVVPNGVDTDLYRPLPREASLVRSLALEGRAVIGFSGELRQKKGLVPLLRALALLADARPITLLALGGVRPDDAGTLELLRRQNPRLGLVLLPHRDPHELPRFYALMDVFVHPSLHDGLPNALLEAMACGRPVVASTAGGIPDVVRDLVDGCLVPPGDPPALAAALAALLDKRDLAATLGLAARARVLGSFSPGVEVARYRALYRALTAAVRTASGGPAARASR
jgi:glycosyltransferase involved in cell wall biosynthesis